MEPENAITWINDDLGYMFTYVSLGTKELRLKRLTLFACIYLQTRNGSSMSQMQFFCLFICKPLFKSTQILIKEEHSNDHKILFQLY